MSPSRRRALVALVAGAGAVAPLTILALHNDAAIVPPPGMVYVPGGVTRIGAEGARPDEAPMFTARVQPFFMDVHPVTVAQFRAFAGATGYATDAERFGNAGVFDLVRKQWRLVDGASWRQPRGPGAPPAPDDHPVTQVSWNDAVAFARWAGKRLPTEIEWEHAARNARDDRSPYSWGMSLVTDGAHRANTWQGHFPEHNTAEDGFLFTSPVGAFGATPLGLTDMGGNVWEWTADRYRSYTDRDRPSTVGRDSAKVQRGGSFLCHEAYCHGYRVSARSHSTPETALFHVGFRLVQDLP
jgi:sulfatase modifying factor 1